MLQSLIRKELEELNEELLSVNQEIKNYHDLNDKKEQLENKKAELTAKLENTIEPLMVPYQKFNFFQRIFSSKYQNYIKEKEKRETEIRDVRSKRQELMEKIEEFTQEEKHVNYQISETKNRQIDWQLQLTTIQQNIQNLDDNKNSVLYLLDKYEYLQQDLEFMKEIVLLDSKNIQYDKTLNNSLYQLYCQKKMEEISSIVSDSLAVRYFQKSYQDVLDEISSPKEVDSSKYKIPKKYLFEEIREQEKKHHGLPMSVLENYHIENVLGIEVDSNYHYLLPESIEKVTYQYFRYDGVYDREYGKKIEELYEDESTLLAIHGTNAHCEEILREGLASKTCDIGNMTYFQSMNNDLDVTYKEGFVGILSYSYKGNTNILFSFPKEVFTSDKGEKIWGKNGGDTVYHVLPEYIEGYVDIHQDTRSFHSNTCLPISYQNKFYDRLQEKNDLSSVKSK